MMEKFYTIGNVLDILHGYFYEGYTNQNVKKVMAYALYKTWQEVDANEREKIEIKGESSDDV